MSITELAEQQNNQFYEMQDRNMREKKANLPLEARRSLDFS